MSSARFKPVTISIPFDDLKVIDAFAAASGLGRSAVIQGFIREALPTLETVTATLLQLQELDTEQRAEMLRQFEAFQREAENLQGEAGAVARAALASLHETKFAKV